jgi:hypothetical protein
MEDAEQLVAVELRVPLLGLLQLVLRRPMIALARQLGVIHPGDTARIAGGDNAFRLIA